MTAYIGYHFQSAPRNWPVDFDLQPTGTLNKFFQVQMLKEAKEHNPNIIGVLRYWDDENQVFNGGDYKQKAREFLARFVDGTFDEHAQYVDYIEGWNEYLANSQTQAEIDERIKWVDALTLVWQNEYRPQPRYSHIRLIVANAAVGNDIPMGIAKLAYERDAAVGYHPYMPVRNGEPFTYQSKALSFIRSEFGIESVKKTVLDQKAKMVPGEEYPVIIPKTAYESVGIGGDMDDGRRYFWLRWQVMDEYWRSNGIFVDWVFTEFGPLNYEEHDWGLHLDGGGGWRHPYVCNGSVMLYIDSIGLFMDEMNKWNVLHGDRAKGGVLFTTNGTTDGVWGLFETAQPEMSNINNFLHNYQPWEPNPPPPPPPDPDPDPDPDSLEDAILKIVVDNYIDANNDSALQKAIWNDGWDLAGPEVWVPMFDGEDYAVKGAVHKDYPDTIRAYYCKVPNWNDVRWVSTKK